jgi:hypothetical protein
MLACSFFRSLPVRIDGCRNPGGTILELPWKISIAKRASGDRSICWREADLNEAALRRTYAATSAQLKILLDASMSSCVVFCCIYFPKVSCASETSASWPIEGVPRRCHFAFSCSARQHKPRQRYPPQVRAMLGFAPNVAGRCWSSNGLQLRSSSSVLHRPGMPSPHETSIDISNLLRASARYLSLCLPVRAIPLLHSPRSSLPHHISPRSNSSSLSILDCRPSGIPDASVGDFKSRGSGH